MRKWEGYKIGCYLNPATMPYDRESGDKNTRILSNYLPEGSFFKKVTTTLLNGNIEKIEFSQSYSSLVNLSEDRAVLLDSMKSKWGEYTQVSRGEKSTLIISDKNNDSNQVVEVTKINPKDDYAMYLFDSIDSPIIGNIVVSESSDLGIGLINVVYISKKMQEYKKEVLNRSNNEKSKKLEGF